MEKEKVNENASIKHSIEMNAMRLDEYRFFRTKSYKNGMTVKFALKLGILDHLKIHADGTDDVYKKFKIHCSENNKTMRDVIKSILMDYKFKKND